MLVQTCIPNRLTLSGPSSEIDRFVRLCIIQSVDGAPESFPFGPLVPEPDVITTLFTTDAEHAKHAAFAATGFDGWAAWRVAHYGTIVTEAMEPVVVQHSSDNVEILFETANSCPLPLLNALAREFPRLRGTIIAVHRWERSAMVGLIANGRLAGFSGEYTVPYFYLLHEARYAPIDQEFARRVQGLEEPVLILLDLGER